MSEPLRTTEDHVNYLVRSEMPENENKVDTTICRGAVHIPEEQLDSHFLQVNTAGYCKEHGIHVH